MNTALVQQKEPFVHSWLALKKLWGDARAPMSPSEKKWTAPQLTYGLTPFKESAPEEKRREAARLQSARIAQLPVDALVVYDLQDESSRTDQKRPFPYLKSIDPIEYAYDYLAAVPQRKIVYRSVSDLNEQRLSDWLARLSEEDAAVFVGAPSVSQTASMKLGDAYEFKKKAFPQIPLGGVLIPERHESRGGEDERVLRKMSRGCRFFVTQAVYSVTASKNVLSDLYFRCQREECEVPELLVTLSPCGSIKTLEFLDWLGVSVPRWLKNELQASADILEKSIELSVANFEELHSFAKEKGIALGCNVESVSLRKSEIEASVEMVHRVRAILDR